MPLISTRGAASAQGFGEFAQSAAPVYIEDVFSTYLYTGNGSTQTITNGIDLSGKGGLVWIKSRSNVNNNFLVDTTRGATKNLESNSTNAEYTLAQGLTAFSGTGFSLGTNAFFNGSGTTFASWTFREQAKFFDIVTFTAPAVGVTTTVSHSLGSTPGCIIMKSTTNTANWVVLHRYDQTMFGELNTTAAFQSAGFNANFTATSFDVKGGFNITANSGTYVAYLFAHDAGGFGLSGTDNVISCGSFTNSGTLTTVNLGWEPQYVLTKVVSTTGNWQVYDNLRGFVAAGGSGSSPLFPNTTGAESSGAGIYPTSTGFQWEAGSGTYIYIAIRRGPMKVPTSGTSVFSPIVRTGTGTTTNLVGVGFAPDAILYDRLSGLSAIPRINDKLRGAPAYLDTSSTDSEVNAPQTISGFLNDGVILGIVGNSVYPNTSGVSFINWFFRRAPGFFDIVCYTGTGSAVAQNHNLSAVPELVIVKKRTAPGYGQDWYVRAPTCVANGDGLILNSTAAQTSSSAKIYSLTSTTFTVQNEAAQNTDTYVAYLFATVAGVSKVGSYTGSGTTKQIDCGFTGGARFVLIKRTDSTGDWYVYDSARGIVAGNDPYLFLNSTAAEVTSTDYVDTYSAGFELSSTAPAAINANGGTFIFLAIA